MWRQAKIMRRSGAELLAVGMEKAKGGALGHEAIQRCLLAIKFRLGQIETYAGRLTEEMLTDPSTFRTGVVGRKFQNGHTAWPGTLHGQRAGVVIRMAAFVCMGDDKRSGFQQ